MKTQLFISQLEPKEEYFQHPKSEMDLKPSGGLWTSTYTGKTGSSWVQFCFSSGTRYGDEPIQSWLITPKNEAKIYVIDSYTDFEELIEKYKYQPPLFQEIQEKMIESANELRLGEGFAKSSYSSTFTYIDFETMSRDYDGMHLTYKGMSETKEGLFVYMEDNELKIKRNKYTLWGYDCECSFWLNWCFENVENLGKKKFECL